jgi:hypothetical protein
LCLARRFSHYARSLSKRAITWKSNMASPKKKRTERRSESEPKRGTPANASLSKALPAQFRVELNPRAEASLDALAAGERETVLNGLREIPAMFGRPHVHSGAGVRQLRSGIYELRIGLQLRAIFVRERDVLVVTFIGTHNGIRKYLRSE